MRRRVRLATSAAFGALAALLAFAGAESARAEVRSERAEVLERYGGEVTQLVVAKGELSSGDVLSESDVEVREWLADLAPQRAITNIDDVIGVRLTSGVCAGEVLTELDVASAEGAVEVPEGRVAISVKVGDKSGVAADTPAGSRVLAYEAAGADVELISSDVTVLGAAGASAYGATERLITLAVDPSCVTRVLAAGADGSLRLALPADDVEVDEGEAAAVAPTSVAAETDGADAEGGEQ